MIYLRLFFLLTVVIFSVSSTFQEDMDQAKMEEMYNCFFAILCKARKPREFRRVMLQADPELIQNGFLWFKEISNIDASDTDEFWDSYPDYKCPLPDETKKEYFIEWMKRLGEYWAEACVDQESEKCVKMGAAEHEYNVVTTEYTANGICSSQAAEFGQEKMEEGKGPMEEGMKQMSGGMPGMG